MEFIKENDDIDKLINYLRDDYNDKKQSDITHFCTVDTVYKWTNEKIRLYPKENLENKKVLTITSSGDHALDAIIKGAKNIDSIDINIFCKYYSALKIAMIKEYDFREFIKNIDLMTMEISNTYIIDILNDVNKYLTEPEFKFWSTYVKYKTGGEPDFFRNFPLDFGCNLYCHKKIYNDLKDKLDDVAITYYDGDIINSPNILNGNRYDYIYLSNILERICKINIRNDLVEEMINILNDKGSIYNYFLGMNYDKLKIIFEKTSNILNDKFNFKYYCDYENEYTCDKGLIQMTLK